jgi:hypothetical protein
LCLESVTEVLTIDFFICAHKKPQLVGWGFLLSG